MIKDKKQITIDEWARSFIGKKMKSKITTNFEVFTVVKYDIGENRNGVWFSDETDFYKAYRKFPRKVRENNG
jgi:hypothetical protein